jgi:aminoglycoside phosphotransferase (APT) family kinase protein
MAAEACAAAASSHPCPFGDGTPGRGLSLALVHLPVDRRRERGDRAYRRFKSVCDHARSLLIALQRIDATDGPPPGQHNFFRGGPLAIYDGETRQAIATLGDRIDADAVTDVWEAALAARWRGSPVWVHGDVSEENLLVRGGRLSAVIDFGSSAVGGPACDLAIAWTLLRGKSRDAFRAALPLDGGTWARGRGWTLWKGLIMLAEHLNTNPPEARKARRVIDEVLADHKRAA